MSWIALAAAAVVIAFALFSQYRLLKKGSL